MKTTVILMLGIFLVGILNACAYVPKKSDDENRKAIDGFFQSEDRAGLEKYFEENSYRSSTAHGPVLNVLLSSPGDERQRSEDVGLNELLKNYDQAVADNERKIQAEKNREANRALLNEAEQKRSEELKKGEAEREVQQEQRKKACRAAGLDFVLQANILVLKKIGPHAYWVQAQGLGPYGDWLCYDKTQQDKVAYTPCGQGKSCAIVKDLAEPVMPYSCGPLYLRYIGTQKVQDENGFDGTAAVWKTMPNSMLESKFQIETKHLGLGPCNVH